MNIKIELLIGYLLITVGDGFLGKVDELVHFGFDLNLCEILIEEHLVVERINEEALEGVLVDFGVTNEEHLLHHGDGGEHWVRLHYLVGAKFHRAFAKRCCLSQPIKLVVVQLILFKILNYNIGLVIDLFCE
jgi:hypothetical protein